MTAPDWPRVCVLCAARDRTTRLESGHCCAACAGWLATQIADIARLAADAAAWVAPGSSTGGSGRPVPGSRPPLRVDALDPELTPIGPPPSATVLEVLEAWTRMIREQREMSPYGPWSLSQTVSRGLVAPAPWDNSGTQYPGEVATSRGATDHREG